MADLSPEEARISELLRLLVVAEAGDDVTAYIKERLENLYPDEYKEYRRRWLALHEDKRPGRCFDFVDWRVMVIRLAKMLGEPLGVKGTELPKRLSCTPFS